MKSKDNASGICILGIMILLVLLPLVAVLFQVICPGLQIENFNIKNLALLLDVFVRPLWKKDLYGIPSILVLASVAAAIPLINRVLVGGMAKIPKSLLIAAQMQGAGFVTRIRTVLLPLLHNSTVSAILAAFGGSVFNLAITTILYPPNYSTLPVYISDSYNDLKFGYAAAANQPC